MQNNKKFFDKLVSRTKIYLFIIFVLLLAIAWGSGQCWRTHQ